jgi:hypothetical protein
MSLKDRIGQVFTDKNGKSSAKRVIGTLGSLVAFYLAIQKAHCNCEGAETTLVLGILTVSTGLIASSIAEKKHNNGDQEGL